jgi:hypothetical protein
MSETQFLTVEELCARFPERTPTAIYTERSRGIGIGSLGVRVGQRLYWRESDINAWFDQKLEEQRATVAS